jgi:predicted nucleic acid-binding protein
MPETITNTSPMLYLYRMGVLEWLSRLCDDIWIPQAVVDELQAGQRKGDEVPIPRVYTWPQIVEPRSVPSAWLALDLGAGELAVSALASDHPVRVGLLDDGRARRLAQAAGLTVWGNA